MRWMIGIVGLMAACAGDTDAQDTDTNTDVTDVTSGDTGNTDTNTDTNTDPVGPGFSGDVYDTKGAPVVGATIKFCQISCQYAETDAKGEWALDEVNTGFNAFEVVPLKGGDLSIGFVPVLVEKGVDRHETMVLPTLDAAQTIPAKETELEIGEGLFITLSDDALEPPLFIDDATETAGALLDPKDYPPLDFEGGEVLAMWYLTPFDHHSKAGLPVEIGNAWSLPVGETFEVWQGVYLTSSWDKAGELTVQKDGRLTGDALLHLMSTTMLVRPPTAKR